MFTFTNPHRHRNTVQQRVCGSRVAGSRPGAIVTFSCTGWFVSLFKNKPSHMRNWGWGGVEMKRCNGFLCFACILETIATKPKKHCLRRSPQTVAFHKSPVCKRSVPCRRNTRRVFPASLAEVRSGVAPSSRRYVRILQRCQSPPSPRHRDRPEPTPRPRWPANPAVSQRRRP